MSARIALFCIGITLIIAQAAAAETINLVGGSTSISTVIAPVKAAFEKATGDRLTITALGSKVALQKLDAGDADAATAGHSFEELTGVIKKDSIILKNRVESLQWQQLAPPATYRVIVNPANPVTRLTRDQVAGIFSGKTTNWKEVGGKDAPILCVVSTLSPGTNDTFTRTFLDGKALSVEALDASSGTDLVQNIASNPEAVGFAASGLVNGTVKAIETVEMKSKPIIIMTVGKPAAKVQRLIDFIRAEGPQYIK